MEITPGDNRSLSTSAIGQIQARLSIRSQPSDIQRVFAIIEALVRPMNLDRDQAAIKAAEWHRQLVDFDPQTLTEAARAVCREKKTWPTIADMVEACREVRRELRGKLPEQRRTWRDDNWHPPTPVEKARVTLLAHAVRERLGFDWYSAQMAKGDAHLIAEAGRIKAARDKDKAA